MWVSNTAYRNGRGRAADLRARGLGWRPKLNALVAAWVVGTPVVAVADAIAIPVAIDAIRHTVAIAIVMSAIGVASLHRVGDTAGKSADRA